MKDSIQILLGIAALIAAIYSVFKIEASIYKSIDSLAKAVHDRINVIDRDFALHVAVYLERKDQVNLHLRGLEEKIDHAKSRLLDEVKELEAKVNDIRERIVIIVNSQEQLKMTIDYLITKIKELETVHTSQLTQLFKRVEELEQFQRDYETAQEYERDRS